MVDEANKRGDFVPIIDALFVTPPAKFLELGADALLATVFRGGHREVNKSKKRKGGIEGRGAMPQKSRRATVVVKKIRKTKKRSRVMEGSETMTMPQKHRRVGDGGSFVWRNIQLLPHLQ